MAITPSRSRLLTPAAAGKFGNPRKRKVYPGSAGSTESGAVKLRLPIDYGFEPSSGSPATTSPTIDRMSPLGMTSHPPPDGAGLPRRTPRSVIAGILVVTIGLAVTACSRDADRETPPGPLDGGAATDATPVPAEPIIADPAATDPDLADLDPTEKPGEATAAPGDPGPDSAEIAPDASEAPAAQPSIVLRPEPPKPRSLADELDEAAPPDDAAEAATREILAPLDDDPQWRADERAAAAFADPPSARRLTKQSRLWIDRQTERVYVDGYVTLREGFLEMFACPVGTKEHESIVATLARSQEVHTALLAVGATPGTPVQYDPQFVPPTGQAIRVWVSWRDGDGEFRLADARDWVQDSQSGENLRENWVFGGSGFWQDPDDGNEYYMAESGDMICVSNFSSAMLDVPFRSSADADSLLFVPATERLPALGTPVRLVLTPIPSDDPDGEAALVPPGPETLPVAKDAAAERSPGDRDDNDNG